MISRAVYAVFIAFPVCKMSCNRYVNDKRDRFLKPIRYCFIEAGDITFDGGIMDYDLQDSRFKRLVSNHANKI